MNKKFVSVALRSSLFALACFSALPGVASAADGKPKAPYTHCDMYRDLCAVTGDKFFCDQYIKFCFPIQTPEIASSDQEVSS